MNAGRQLIRAILMPHIMSPSATSKASAPTSSRLGTLAVFIWLTLFWSFC